MGIQEIGARFVVLGKAELLAALKEAQAAVDALNRSMVSGAAKARAATMSANPISALADSAMLAQKARAAQTAAQYDKVAKVGKAAFFGLAGVMGVVGYESVKQASAFDAAMERVSTQAGVAQSRIGALSQGVQSMAGSVGQGPTQLADALYRIASANAGLGATNQQLLQMTKYAAQLAALGGPGTDLDATSRVFGSIKASGISGASNPHAVAAWANAVVGAGDIKMSDLVSFFGTGVLPAGSLAGVSIQDLGAALALMGDNAISGQVSGHALTHALSLMAAPSGVASKAMTAVGLNPLDLGNVMRDQGLTQGIGFLRQALWGPLSSSASPSELESYGISAQDIAQAQKVGFGAMGSTGQTDIMALLTKMFGGAKQAVPVDTMIVEYNRLLAKRQQVIGQSGLSTYDSAVSRQMNTLAGRTHQFTSAISALETALGRGLTPVAKDFLRVGTDLATFFTNSTWAAYTLGGAITTVLGPAIGLYLVRKFQTASGAIVDVVKGYAKLVKMILKQLIPSLFAEDTALATTTAAERVLGTTAVTTAGEEGVLAASSRGAGAAGLVSKAAPAVAAGAGAVATVGVGSALLLGGDNRQNQVGQNYSADLRGLIQNVTGGKYTGVGGPPTAAQAAAALNWLQAHPGGGSMIPAPLAAAESKWLMGQLQADMATANAQHAADVKALQSVSAAVQNAAQQINLSVNLDGKQVAKSTVKVVRQQSARS